MNAADSQVKPSVLIPFRPAAYHMKTLYLFTRSDIKTIVLPNVRPMAVARSSRLFSLQLCIAIALNRQTSPVQALKTLLWIWLLLLTFCVSNQASARSVIEDRINKSWRPIPSSRITIQQAGLLRWFLVFLSLSVSALHGNLTAAAIILAAEVAYNDLGLSDWWFTKSLVNAVGYMGFQYGAVTIISGTPLLFLLPSYG